MPDEKPVPETLETIADRLTLLGKSIDERFARFDQHFAHIDQGFEQIDQRFAQVDHRFEQIDQRFAQVDHRFEQIDQRFAQVDQRFTRVDQQFATIDEQFEETRAQLGVKIEAVDERVKLVYEAVVGLQMRADSNDAAHAEFTKRLDDHQVRIIALERRASRRR